MVREYTGKYICFASSRQKTEFWFWMRSNQQILVLGTYLLQMVASFFYVCSRLQETNLVFKSYLARLLYRDWSRQIKKSDNWIYSQCSLPSCLWKFRKLHCTNSKKFKRLFAKMICFHWGQKWQVHVHVVLFWKSSAWKQESGFVNHSWPLCEVTCKRLL